MKTPSLLDIVKLLPARDITRAAKALGLSPDTLLKRVGSLESVVGTKLMDTAAKALKPGEAGRLMIDHASRIFTQARDFTRDLEELAGLQAPEIVFGTDMFAAELPLGIALGRMATANSRLRVHTVTADFDDLARSVMAGKIEFAIADTTSRRASPDPARHRAGGGTPRVLLHPPGTPADGRPGALARDTARFPARRLACSTPNRHAHRSFHADGEG